MRFNVLPIIALSGVATMVSAGPLAYAACQTGTYTTWRCPHASLLLPRYSFLCLLLAGCNTLAVACYAAAGLTFGTVVAAAAAPAAAMGCNAALGTCSATCATVALLAPTPWTDKIEGSWIMVTCLWLHMLIWWLLRLVTHRLSGAW